MSHVQFMKMIHSFLNANFFINYSFFCLLIWNWNIPNVYTSLIVYKLLISEYEWLITE